MQCLRHLTGLRVFVCNLPSKKAKNLLVFLLRGPKKITSLGNKGVLSGWGSGHFVTCFHSPGGASDRGFFGVRNQPPLKADPRVFADWNLAELPTIHLFRLKNLPAPTIFMFTGPFKHQLFNLTTGAIESFSPARLFCTPQWQKHCVSSSEDDDSESSLSPAKQAWKALTCNGSLEGDTWK